MPSRVDPNHPANGVAVSKAVSRANWTAAKAELEHGGFFAQAETGALERPVADRLAETISARDFGALGDDSGATVNEWLTGGTHSRSAADLAELRAMTAIADLELDDTIDWAAITAAKNAAGGRPVFLTVGRYRLSRSLVFERGGLVGEAVAIGSSTDSVGLAPAPGLGGTFDVIRLEPPANNRTFFFKNIHLGGGLRGLYGRGPTYVGALSQFENISISAASQEGFFFDDLQAIGVLFSRIKVEACGSHGIRFRGHATLNASQIFSSRVVGCGGCGFLFENTHSQADTAAVLLNGLLAEYNDGPGMKLVGYKAVLVCPYFEANDRDASGDPDLVLASTDTTPSKVHASVTCIQPYFTVNKNPEYIKIAGSPGGTQRLLLIQPEMPRDAKINTSNLILSVTGGTSDQFIIQGSRRPALFNVAGLALVGATSVTTTPSRLGVLAAPMFPTGVMQVLATQPNGDVASYLLRRNSDGTVTALHTAGEDFLTFGVDGAGRITVATMGGTATVSAHGH